ncbi:MAG: chloride channel protein [Patescibacteria group bacterium]|nr:chloride channel protein [Patescibacteria group bacterium]
MFDKYVRKKLSEQTAIFITVAIWTFLASLTGLIVGFAATVFLKILDWSSFMSARVPYYFLALPLALFISTLLVKYLAPDAEGHGTEKVIEAIHKYSGKIKLNVVPVKVLATVITLAAGGSVGKEGPTAQIGAGIASFFADIFRFDNFARRKIVICGISAGFAAVFGTPIAGAIFGVEVLFIGGLLYDVLFPSFVAGITAYEVSSYLGIHYFHEPVKFLPVFNEAFFLKMIIAGVFFGLISFLLVESLEIGKKVAHKIPLWEPAKGILGGILLCILVFIFSKQYLGLGLDSIANLLQGGQIVWYAFLVKMLFTTITLNFGGSGGIVTPIFFIGSAAGVMFGNVMGLDTGTMAAIGLTGLLAGAANTPIAASIMAIELFGPQIAPYAAIVAVVSYLMTGHRSVYPSQILSVKKSRYVDVEVGKEIQGIQAIYNINHKNLVNVAVTVFKKIGVFRKTNN